MLKLRRRPASPPPVVSPGVNTRVSLLVEGIRYGGRVDDAYLAPGRFEVPMQGNLLWVYEGMTRYLGDFVLSGRSGMRTAEEDREYAAWVAANAVAG